MEAFAPSFPLLKKCTCYAMASSPRRRPRPSGLYIRACADSQPQNSLLDTLKSDDQPKQVLALISLHRTPAKEALSLIRQSGVLDTENRQVRIAALTALGKIGIHEETNTLVEVLLHDPDHSIRAAAANGLAHMFEPETRKSEMKEKAVEALKQAATQDEHFIVRYAAIVSVGNLGEPSCVEMLLPIATDLMAPALEVAAAVTALGEVVTEQAVDEGLLKAVSARADDREDFIRAAVARTLGRWGDFGDARNSLEKMRVNEEKYGQSDLVRAILSDVFSDGNR